MSPAAETRLSGGRKLSPLPYRWSGTLLALVFGAAAVSQVKLQVFEKEATIALAQGTNRYAITRRDPARRGSILTADGQPLARDAGSDVLTVQYAKVPGAPAFYLDLAAATGLPATELAAREGEARTRTWPGPFSPEQASMVRDVRSRWRADGVSIAAPAGALGARSYPMGEDVACIVGVQRELGVKGAGGAIRAEKVRTGLEASLQDRLQGRDGKESGLADRNGIMLPLRTTESVERRDGDDVVTTLDSRLQAIAAKAVRKAVETNKAENGVAIVLDPATGDVRAMANWPSFDPNAGADNAAVGYDPAYMGVFEPGSTFKILTLAKALDAGKTTMGSWIGCGGELHYNRFWRVRCDAHHGNRAHGSVDPVKAIAKSCNVAAATWALKIGRDPFIEYMTSLGLLDKTSLGLPREVRGRYNVKEYAKPLQLMQFGFGQSVSVSPVALAGAFGALANGGVRREPRLVARVGGREVTPEPGRRVLGEEACAEVRRCMEAVIETDGGTGASLRIPGYRLAGKTGTAEKKGKGQSGYVASFIGFVPARAPEAVVLVMINRPQGKAYYGALVAGPVFKTLAEAVIERDRIAPDAVAAAREARSPGAKAGPSVEVSAQPVRPLKRDNKGR